MALKLAVFDLDGTLLVPALDFEAIRTEIGLPPVVPILETMEALRGPERERAFAILDRHEAEAAARSALMPGAFIIPHTTWLGVDRRLLSLCKILWRLRGWEHSVGSLQEIAFAEASSPPIVIVDSFDGVKAALRWMQSRGGNYRC